MKTRKEIDHLVYCVFDLGQTMDRVEKQLGVRPQFGGYHKTQGTKNALLRLGEDCYFELLAIDNDNEDIKPPRWMGVDLLSREKITRLAVKSNSLENDSQFLRTINPEMALINGEE